MCPGALSLYQLCLLGKKLKPLTRSWRVARAVLEVSRGTLVCHEILFSAAVTGLIEVSYHCQVASVIQRVAADLSLFQSSMCNVFLLWFFCFF
jgi:hypothetical protein